MRFRVVAALTCTLAASPLGAAEPPLRVGLDPRIPPWSFIPGLHADEDVAPSVTDAQLQRAQGIDVDVAAALGRRLGDPCESCLWRGSTWNRGCSTDATT